MEEKRYKVLVIDDEEGYRMLASDILSERFSVATSASSDEALRLMKASPPDLILLDIRMPDVDGVTLCDRLRQTALTRHIPIVMLTAAHDVTHRVKAFQAGADDFIGKPFTDDELLMRVDSKIRRLRENESPRNVVSCGNLVVDVDSHRVTLDGAVITVTAHEFKLLHFLVINRGRLCTRQEILRQVWSDCVVTGRAIDTHLCSLRKKLRGFTYVFESIYARGYLLRPNDAPAPEPAPEPTAN